MTTHRWELAVRVGQLGLRWWQLRSSQQAPSVGASGGYERVWLPQRDDVLQQGLHYGEGQMASGERESNAVDGLLAIQESAKGLGNPRVRVVPEKKPSDWALTSKGRGGQRGREKYMIT